MGCASKNPRVHWELEKDKLATQWSSEGCDGVLPMTYLRRSMGQTYGGTRRDLGMENLEFQA